MKRIILALLSFSLVLGGCAGKQEKYTVKDDFKTWYEIFVASYYDSDGDKTGDIEGVIKKLDYIEDMGFSGIWLMPIMPSGTYHKYDVDDYCNVDSAYGELSDFKKLVGECHKRNISIIIDLPLNHTSLNNEWFKSATASLKNTPCGKASCTYENSCPDHNKYCGYYNFSKEKQGGSWYKVEGSDYFYEGVFWSGMPDLNLEDENLRKDIEDIAKFWLVDMGIDGFRLDAAKEFFTGNLEKNIEFLSWFNDTCNEIKPDTYLVAEVWETQMQSKEYYKSGIDSLFNFEYAGPTGRIARCVGMAGAENGMQRFCENLQNTQELFKGISKDAVDAPFFSNHDMARSIGYFRNDGDKMKFAWGLNLTMSGAAFVYYGEEIGMSGSGIDENKRLAMRWSDAYEKGLCNNPENAESITHTMPPLDVQLKDKASLCNYIREVIKLRNKYIALRGGEVTALAPFDDFEVAGIKKTYGNEELIVIYNGKEEEVSINHKDYDFNDYVIKDSISVEFKESQIENGKLILPKYSITILQVDGKDVI